MSAESPRHARTSGGPLTVPAQPPSDRGLIDAVSGFISDVTLSSSSTQDPKDVIQWARFETADINEPTPEGDGDNDISPLLLILGYGSGVQVWLIPPTGEAQEVLSWRQGTVRVLRILPSPQRGDCFASKRPLVALCDSASPGPSFCSLSFISIRGGEQVKSIKFKNQILDVLANKRSVVVSFAERFAVFDAGTLEDRLAVTTCFPCPCPLGGATPVNPLALGDRWLAFADKKLNQSKRSSGGCEGEGQTSYTATVLHAAKSLSKGLRGLGESVAHSLGGGGGRAASQSPSPPNADSQQPGIVTILDIEGADEETQENDEAYDPIVAHFVAHSDAIIALKFDASGMLLVTADRRGHDFHVFRINPHPCGPSLASVHHLYVLHRGDTTAKVQDIALSPDSRWAAISTLRGTTHIFPLSPYGGACGVRTHTAPRLVNRLSRFHRSAGLGLPIHPAQSITAAGSPVNDGASQGLWFPNPCLPPYPLPVAVTPLAQLRPTAHLPTHTITRTSSGRQRLSSLSEEHNAAPLLARARFGAAPLPPGPPGPPASKAGSANALYLITASGCLSHIALHPRPARNIPKEKICDESPIELEVEPLAQWALQRPATAADLLAPLPASSPLLAPLSCRRCADMCMSEEERWLSQVEIVTHAGPHRRLWMGPQFVFKTYNLTGSNSSLSEAETVEVELSASRGVARSNPVNMPGARPIVPVLIDSGSPSSLEHSPSDSFRRKSLLNETGRAASVCDVQLKEDLAEAMKEDHGWRETGTGLEARARCGGGVARVVDPLGTVLAPPPSRNAPPLDNDDYTTPNSDEATFRPVVRAPATLTLGPDMLIRPLPRTTTIPVQNVSPLTSLSPEDEPLPLNTDVFIPATLTRVQGCHASNQLEEDELQLESVLFDASDSKSDAGEIGNFYAQEDAKLDKSIDNKTTRKNIDTNKKTQNNETDKDNVQKERPKSEKSYKKEGTPTNKTFQLEKPASYQKESNTVGQDDRQIEIPCDKVTEQKKKNNTSADKTSRQKDKEKSSGEKPNRKKEKEDKTLPQKDTVLSDKKADNTLQITVTEKELHKANTLNKEKSQKESGCDKTTHHKESTPKPENNSVQEEIIEKKVGKKEKAMKNEKRSGQKDMPIKLDKSTDQNNAISENGTKIVAEKAKNEVEIAPTFDVTDLVTKVDRINLDDKRTNVNKDLISEQIDDRVYDSERARGSAERAERDDSKSLPKSNQLPGDIQPTARIRVKKSPTMKSVSDKDSEGNVKNTKTKKIDETCNVTEPNDVKETKFKEPKQIRKQKDDKESIEPRNDKNTKEIFEEASNDKNISKYLTQNKSKIEILEPSLEVELKLPIKEVVMSYKEKDNIEIKTEDQAWDMLLSEPDKPVALNINEISTTSEKSTEEKPKTRRNRKMKKSQDETQNKSEDDSFVEIHAIEEKQQICSGDLVSISTPFEGIERSSKATKTRSPKCCTPEKTGETIELVSQTQEEPTPKPRSGKKFDVMDISAFSGPSFVETIKEPLKDFGSNNSPKTLKHCDGSISETTSILIDSQPKKYKSKSLSPYPELRKPDIVVDVDKDVYVIDTTEEEFPEIQITRGNKPNRRSPQPAERKSLDNNEKRVERFEPVAQTIKSWSSIAAAKNKKIEEINPTIVVIEKPEKTHIQDEIENNDKKDVENATAVIVERPMSDDKVSVEEKLLELYKRSDIMVAECDAPSELNFVEEHHSVMDLPPLEPLDFGLDDFKLEVMRDSLMDVNEAKITSPICKINIDDILSSIKETTSKAIESSAFNLIDLEKVPAKKERGFSVIESHKITSQEVKLEDDIKEEEVMEKSSDDDNTSPAVTTDSDKEDKKFAGASNLTLPASKQSNKAKKPRRKKK